MRTLLPILFLLFSCHSDTKVDKKIVATNSKNDTITPTPPTIIPEKVPKIYEEFDRSESLNRIKAKVAAGKPLVVHVFVPLCDNENQGIVPVNKNLGDGLNLNTNLYWGARYGMKSYFRLSSKWKLLESVKEVNSSILERVVFFRTYPNGTKVYLVADAFRGDKMKVCLMEFMQAISGASTENMEVKEQQMGVKSEADLIVFNGHNGLMDYKLDFVDNVDEKVRDVGVIGCVSHPYFKEHLKHTKAYPLLMTTGLMAPEAYIMEAFIDNWAELKTGKEIRLSAGKAYHKYQKCGIKGATNLFKTGWQ